MCIPEKSGRKVLVVLFRKQNRHSFALFRLFMVFECLEMDLRKYLDQIPQGKYMDKELVKSYMHQVTQGILYCHIRRILHRDIKPQNLLITRDGRIKVITLLFIVAIFVSN